MSSSLVKNNDIMILYVLEIKYKNEWKMLIKFESRAFHDLSQISKWSGTRKQTDFDPFLNWFKSRTESDSNQNYVIWIKCKLWFESIQRKPKEKCGKTVWFESSVKSVSNQIKQRWPRSFWFESSIKSDSNHTVSWF